MGFQESPGKRWQDLSRLHERRLGCIQNLNAQFSEIYQKRKYRLLHHFTFVPQCSTQPVV